MISRRDLMKSTALLGVAATGHALGAMAARGDEAKASDSEAINISSRRELFVDQYLIERLDGVRLELHRPMRREVVFRTDAPWEGNSGCYQSVFRDGDIFRVYYRGGHVNPSKAYEKEKRSWEILCMAESRDGIHWTRPELNVVEFQGSKKNNLDLDANMVREIGGRPSHTSVFKDTNPDCPDGERYKIVIVGSKPKKGLYLLVSADGVHFQLKSQQPFTTSGAFDSQNLMFWDSVGKVYREYHRDFDHGVRGIRTAASPAPDSFPEPHWLEYPGAAEQALYTNQILPYYRAPHIFMGFPLRYDDRGWSPSMNQLPGLEERQYRASKSRRYGTALTDAAFMSSRDGVTFARWYEAFIRPGPATKDTWVYGDNFVFWGMLQTKSDLEGAPDDISLYATEGYWEGDSISFRRYTLRQDGFVSVHAGGKAGSLLTKPLVFEGSQLHLNFATSAMGSIQIEIQDAEGKPVKGFAMKDCPEFFGDTIDRTVTWKDNKDMSSLAGKPVRLRFEIKDADIFSFQFTDSVRKTD